MKNLIKYIAEALVDYPEQVDVSEVQGEQTSVIELKWPRRTWARLSANKAARHAPYGPF